MSVNPIVDGCKELGRHSSRLFELGVETGLDFEDAMVSLRKNAPAEVGAGFLLELLKRLDIEVGRLVHVQAAEEPEDRDVELSQEGSRVEAARPVASHLRIDLSEWFRERLAALARER